MDMEVTAAAGAGAGAGATAAPCPAGASTLEAVAGAAASSLAHGGPPAAAGVQQALQQELFPGCRYLALAVCEAAPPAPSASGNGSTGSSNSGGGSNNSAQPLMLLSSNLLAVLPEQQRLEPAGLHKMQACFAGAAIQVGRPRACCLQPTTCACCSIPAAGDSGSDASSRSGGSDVSSISRSGSSSSSSDSGRSSAPGSQARWSDTAAAAERWGATCFLCLPFKVPAATAVAAAAEANAAVAATAAEAASVCPRLQESSSSTSPRATASSSSSAALPDSWQGNEEQGGYVAAALLLGMACSPCSTTAVPSTSTSERPGQHMPQQQQQQQQRQKQEQQQQQDQQGQLVQASEPPDGDSQQQQQQLEPPDASQQQQRQEHHQQQQEASPQAGAAGAAAAPLQQQQGEAAAAAAVAVAAADAAAMVPRRMRSLLRLAVALVQHSQPELAAAAATLSTHLALHRQRVESELGLLEVSDDGDAEGSCTTQQGTVEPVTAAVAAAGAVVAGAGQAGREGWLEPAGNSVLSGDGMAFPMSQLSLPSAAAAAGASNGGEGAGDGSTAATAAASRSSGGGGLGLAGVHPAVRVGGPHGGASTGGTGMTGWRYYLLMLSLLTRQVGQLALLLLPAARRTMHLDALLRFKDTAPQQWQQQGQRQRQVEQAAAQQAGWGVGAAAAAAAGEGGDLLEAQFLQYHSAMMANKLDAAGSLILLAVLILLTKDPASTSHITHPGFMFLASLLALPLLALAPGPLRQWYVERREQVLSLFFCSALLYQQAHRNFMHIVVARNSQSRYINAGFAWLTVDGLLLQMRFCKQLPTLLLCLAVNLSVVPEFCAAYHPHLAPQRCAAVAVFRGLLCTAMPLVAIYLLELRVRRAWLRQQEARWRQQQQQQQHALEAQLQGLGQGQGQSL